MFVLSNAIKLVHCTQSYCVKNQEHNWLNFGLEIFCLSQNVQSSSEPHCIMYMYNCTYNLYNTSSTDEKDGPSR